MAFVHWFHSFVMDKAEKHRDNSLSYLKDSWYLHSSKYLGEIYDNATLEGKESIYDHMLNHGVIHEDYKGYLELAHQIEHDLERKWKM
jgi:hypothetical protein